MPPNAEKLGKGIHGSYFLDGAMYFATAKDQAPDGRRNAGVFRVKYVLTEPAKAKSTGKPVAKESKDNLDESLLIHQVNINRSFCLSVLLELSMFLLRLSFV